MKSGSHRIELIDEPTYTFKSADNLRSYDAEVLIGESPGSAHGVLIDGHPSIVVGADRGATRVHAHSLLRLDDVIYFAVGPYVSRLTPGRKTLDWSVQLDWAACLGVYYSEPHEALISHGELSIARFDREGKILWSGSGADIFSEGVRLFPDYIEAIDSNQSVYRFDYQTGEVRVGL